jgi:hypothetical protein
VTGQRAAGAEVAADPGDQGSSLAADVAALDRARQALASKDGPGALAALDEHDRGRPTGVLSPEATVLRIQALQLAGDRTAAAALARRFIAAFPKSPHVPRLQALASEEQQASGERAAGEAGRK